MKIATVATVVAAVAAVSSAGKAAEIDLMTLNQYLGADLSPIVVAALTDPAAVNGAVLTALEQVAANDFVTRAGLQADLIKKRRPDVIALQEVYRFGCTDLLGPNPGQGCDDPAIANAFQDHLQLTMDLIGQPAPPASPSSYHAAATVEQFDFSIPVDSDEDGNYDILINVLDRDMILVRAGLNHSVANFAPYCPGRESVDGCNFSEIVVIPGTPVGDIRQERGWVGIDVTVDGRDYRIVNTHLEVRFPDASNPLSAYFQAAQAAELLAVMAVSAAPGRSQIILGDINSSPVDTTIAGFIVPPYAQLVDAGYSDAWTEGRGSDPGYTCCQLADLSNVEDNSTERIDVIFSAELPSKVHDARVLGVKVGDKSSPFGLWPSDHGAVAARLRF